MKLYALGTQRCCDVESTSVQTKTGLTRPSNLPFWSWILNWFAKPCVSLAQTIFILAVKLDLAQNFLDWGQLCCYEFTVLGIQTEGNWITKLV